MQKQKMNWFATVLRVVICFIIIMDLTEFLLKFCVDEVFDREGLDMRKRRCRCSGNGGPQTFLPAACDVAQAVAQYGLSTSTQVQDPHEGPSLAGWTTQGFLRGGLTRQAREEAERSRQGYLTRSS